MIAADVTSYAETVLGLGEYKSFRAEVLLHRLAEVVRRVQDRQGAQRLEKGVTTLEGQGVYELGRKYETIRGVDWPEDWQETDPSIAAYLPSSLLNTIGTGSEPMRWVTENELIAAQKSFTAGGASVSRPYIWSHWRRNDVMSFALAPKEGVEAGLQIDLVLTAVDSDDYAPDDEVPVERKYEMYLKYLVTEQAALYAAGMLIARNDPRGRDMQASAVRFRNMADEELGTIKRAHQPVTQTAEVTKMDTPFPPPIYE